ncbi:MAG TPA: polyketide synthase dehydratase domain-containing protein, partial [Actinocrinis sp.]|nr:polyketide synthase dehydratase domain-containing protein [Actinocrinis sp.]
MRARRLPIIYASHSAAVDPLQEHLSELLAGVTAQASDIAFYSTVSAEPVDTTSLDAEYWFQNVRQPVQFEAAVARLHEAGYTTFLECGPHPVLTTAIQEILEAREPSTTAALITGVLRRDHTDQAELLTALGRLHNRGHAITWPVPAVANPVPYTVLPTYPFEHRPYWLDVPPLPSGDPAQHGLSGTRHPILTAAAMLADRDTALFTGRLALDTHPWLADHAVNGTVLLPGTALLDIALHAGLESDCSRVEELTLHAPLPIPDSGAVHVHALIGAPDDDGRRTLTIQSRPESAAADAPWTRHATATITASSTDPADSVDSAATSETPLAGMWPPETATPLVLDGMYERIADAGYEYGPAFQGLTAAWRDGDDILAEVRLPATEHDDAARFAIHPALLDAALHATILLALDEAQDRPDAPIRLPFNWSDVTLHATGASALRVRLRPDGADRLAVTLADTRGAAVLDIEALNSRALTADDLAALSGTTGSSQHDSLFQLDWTELGEQATPTPLQPWSVIGDDSLQLTPNADTSVALADGLPPSYPDVAAFADALAESERTPAFALAVIRSAATDVMPQALHETTERALALVKSWLAEERCADIRLIIATCNAVATGTSSTVADQAASAIWGLIRSAQAEHPDRLTLLDLDDSEVSGDMLALAAACGEPQLALREGVLLVPRIARLNDAGALQLPEGDAAWSLRLTEKGSLDNVRLLPNPEVERPLEAGQVRIAVRAAGLNFRDVLITLGMVGEGAGLLGEGAGEVVELGPAVTGFAPGDRVAGMFEHGVGTLTVSDHRLIARIPTGWTYAQAATTPVAFLTAYYAMRHLAALQPGDRILIHAATGGVGTAALQLARHMGLEVFAT